MENAHTSDLQTAPYDQSFDEIVADFELLDDWEDRYRYVIELGRKLPPLPETRAHRRKQGSRLRQSGLARDERRS